MKVLVTGGCGFIGSNYIRYALAQHEDLEIVNLDALTYAGNLENLKDLESDQRLRFVRADISVMTVNNQPALPRRGFNPHLDLATNHNQNLMSKNSTIAAA